MSGTYDADYFQSFRAASRSSAAAMVPRVVELVRPRSVVDVGCGVAEWAAAFQAMGIEDVLGIDGADVGRELRISPDRFVSADLTSPLEFGREFDLAISLEVAEHLPHDSADSFVKTLATLAPVVLFSAASPGQGGHSHLNEQWPDYWVSKFAEHGFAPLDLLRGQFWSDARVEWWYAQNALLFAQAEPFQAISKRAGVSDPRATAESLVHPRNLERHRWRERVLATCVDLAAATSPGARIVLADDDAFGDVYVPSRMIVPFTEQHGAYAGPPADDDAAITELERQVAAGASHFAFGWTCFWQREHYQRFEERLVSKCELLVENENLALFRLVK